MQKLYFIALIVLFSTLTKAQTGTITGKIISDKNEELIGASVKVTGTQFGAATDIDGNFKIENVPAGDQTLEATYIGYQKLTQKVTVSAGGTTTINLKLKEDSKTLNDVVVVGYGTQVKKDLSSSVVSIKSDEVEDKPVYNFTSALQGKASGVQITTDNGAAGAATTVRIRGTKTLSNTAEPLYVVDGVPIISNDISDAGGRVGYNTSVLSTINPNDIESIEILKDAAATAIYGARGANGVIIVTTKSGKAGRTKIDVSYNGGFSQVARKIKLLDGPTYLQLYKEAAANDGNNSPTLPENLDESQVANTNWIDKVLRTGYYNEASLSASGGNDKLNFFIGGGLRDEKTFLKGNAFQRISFRTNVNYNSGKVFECGTNVGVTYTSNKYVPNAWAGGLGAAQSYMLPIFPVYDTAGNYIKGAGNPLAQIELIKNDGKTWRLLNNTYAAINFLKGFTFRNEFGIDLVHQHEEFYKPKEITGDSAIAEDRRIQYLTWNYTTTLGYKKSFKQDKHQFEALVGFNPTRTLEKFAYMSGRGFTVPSQTQVQGAGQITFATAGTGREYSFLSYFTRINYKLLSRYLFQFSFRADGSSRFSPSKRFGYFPSGSVAWIISEEKFLQENPVLTFLKLRASVGTSGNAEFTDDFAYFSAFSSGQNYGGSPGIGPSNTSVPDLTWETSLKTNVAVDFGLWDDRLSGTIEYYYEKTSNMLVQGSPLTPSSGFSSVTRNIGSLQNTGMELQLTSNNFGPQSPVKWKTTFNIAFNRNKILDLGNVTSMGGTNFGDNRAIVGYPVGTWVLAKYAGVDPATGAPLIYDSLGNKIIADATSTVKYRFPVANPYPLFFGGISNTFEWKGIELEIFLTYSYGNKIYDDGGKRQLGNMAFGWNQDVRVLDRWQKEGDITDIPKLSLNTNYDFNTTLHLHDASFLRLRTLTIAYNLPEKALNKMKMRSWRIFISGQNLAVATKFKGWDPEVNRERSGAITQGVTYLSPPQARTISFGINVGL